MGLEQISLFEKVPTLNVTYGESIARVGFFIHPNGKFWKTHYYMPKSKLRVSLVHRSQAYSKISKS